MNGIEERLKSAFDAKADTVSPHSRAWTENARRIRGARTRRAITVPSAAVAVAAAAAAVPLAFPGLADGGPAAASDTGGFPPELVDESTIVRIPAKLPGGATFTADTLGADGTVLGRSADSRVWKAGPRGGTPKPLGVRAQGGLAAGQGFVTWIAPGAWELNCRTPNGRTRVIGPQGATPDSPVFAGGGRIIASDPMDQPFVTTGCTTGDTLASPGKAVAFSYPILFTVDVYTKHVLREVDVRTGRIVREHPLPTGVRTVRIPEPEMRLDRERSKGGVKAYTAKPSAEKQPEEQQWQAAANDRYFAWGVNGVLRVMDRRTWKELKPLPMLPSTRERAEGARLTAGSHVIAYSVPGGSTMLYDTRSRTVPYLYRREVYAAGDWLLWRAPDGYRLAKAR
ncbi:hypothetical protein [Actinomadura fibrosa]|uniref:Uncharacterized protein n=1 Tax=Actinomadura fibrosa TaxID=111802 RepID=A0ABW2XN55_9ACTN|nr:hypothetical protein [Actinomadura fibrosa]